MKFLSGLNILIKRPVPVLYFYIGCIERNYILNYYYRNSSSSSSTSSFKSALIFENADLNKLIILEKCKNKSGIYMWTNLINNKKYVGSSVKRMSKDRSMPINVALLKYRYSNFKLEILEFCDIDLLMKREKYYMDLFNPEYNILLNPGSPSAGICGFVVFLYQRRVGPSLIIRDLPLVSPLIINGFPCIKSKLGNVRNKLLTYFPHSSKIREYSTISVTPLKVIKGYNLVKYYPDLHFKSQMVKENKKLSGVYIIINNITNKIYIGSSLDLGRRLSIYFTNSFPVRNKTMIISKALIKHGYLNFSVGILEYCSPDKRIERENYYFGLLTPEYNVLKVAGSPPIIKEHTVKTRLKMSINSGLAIAVRFKDI